jgi:RimJ/RimL family protein N-acetyltransferase
MTIRTARLDLIPASADCLRAALRSSRDLEAALGIAVPATWPPELFDASALEFARERLTRHGEPAEWWLHYFVRRANGDQPALLIGGGGFKGPPREGVVEIGYSVLAEHRRLGYAAEATLGMAARAFLVPTIERVLAHTLPELTPSIGVLEKCGFRRVEGTREEGAIQFELTRSGWLRSPGVPGSGQR